MEQSQVAFAHGPIVCKLTATAPIPCTTSVERKEPAVPPFVRLALDYCVLDTALNGKKMGFRLGM